MIRTLTIFVLIGLVTNLAADGSDPEVKISPTIESISVMHNNERLRITREQNLTNQVNEIYAKTSRPCPPFCIQPMVIAPGVETIGELELLDHLRRIASGDDSILVIDSRIQSWVDNGTIPGSVNIPWTTLSPTAGADPFGVADILEARFGVISQEGLWNFESAKTLVLFCNGMWCAQSPTTIKTLLNFGYPADRIKWYRGGMQNWENLGLTVIR